MAKISGDVEEGALFRYSLIIPALNGTFSERSINEYFVNIASKEHTLPDGTKKYFDKSTLRNWYYQYRKYGFDGLKHCSRRDKGVSKKVPISILETIEEIRENRPRITKREIYEELCKLGEIRRADVAESTFYRFLTLNEKSISVSRKRV